MEEEILRKESEIKRELEIMIVRRASEMDAAAGKIDSQKIQSARSEVDGQRS